MSDEAKNKKRQTLVIIKEIFSIPLRLNFGLTKDILFEFESVGPCNITIPIKITEKAICKIVSVIFIF